jgi:hypothetical protein
MARIKKGDPELLLVSFCDILTISISALFMATIVTVFEATKVPELSMTPRTIETTKQPVFFECRSNELFAVDLGGLQEQLETVLKTVDPEASRRGWSEQILKVIQGRQITNRYYRVNTAFLLTGHVALEPVPNVSGEPSEQVGNAAGRFQSVLRNLDFNSQYLVFLVRDDSFSIFRKARQVADDANFDTSWELLGSGEAIKFGATGTKLGLRG